MSLLSVTVKKARFVGVQASQWSVYCTLKLQNVKCTTVTVKGATPSWEQDFVFELNNLDVGLLIEVWNKGVLWDKVLGYHWLRLQEIHCSNVAGSGQWFELDAELVMREGEVIGTKNPTGHKLLVDARFELPLGECEGDETQELQRKLEMLNSMLDQGNRNHDQAFRQQQFYNQCESGVSEDSDYTSDVNFPVGQHPNSSASQFRNTAYQLTSPDPSFSGGGTNCYEAREDYSSTHYPTAKEGQKGRLLPKINPPTTDQYWLKDDSKNYEADPLYYNSRPQPLNSFSNYKEPYNNGIGYNYNASGYADDYDEEYYDATDEPQHYLRKLGKKSRSLERQDTMYHGTENYPKQSMESYGDTYYDSLNYQDQVQDYATELKPNLSGNNFSGSTLQRNAKADISFNCKTDAPTKPFAYNEGQTSHDFYASEYQGLNNSIENSVNPYSASGIDQAPHSVPNHDYYYDEYSYNSPNTAILATDQTVPQGNNPQDDEAFDFENWDFTNGYYDEKGNFIPYQGYYDESGNFIATDAPIPVDEYGTESSYNTEPTKPRNISDNNDKYANYNNEAYSEGYQYEYPEQTTAEYNEYYYPEETIDYQPNSAKNKIIEEIKPPPKSSVEYNYAYQSAENLSSSIPEKSFAENLLDRANSVIRRKKFRRQASTLDSEGGPSELPHDETHPAPVQTTNTHDSIDFYSVSMDDSHYDAYERWSNEKYESPEENHRGSSYEHYEDAHETHKKAETEINDGPVHMDSLESNSSDHGVRDQDANEKFEAQYWQRQRERIAQQATLCTQDSQDYYGYDPYSIPDRTMSIDAELPPSMPITSVPPEASHHDDMREEETEWKNESIDDDEWVTRQARMKLRKESTLLSHQDTMESEQNDIQNYSEDHGGDEESLFRKHSSVSVDSEGLTLPPTSPPPGEKLEHSFSLEDDATHGLDRNASVDIPGKDKGSKTVSFDEEPKVMTTVDRLTKGMTSREKWLWSMNRICSSLQVS